MLENLASLKVTDLKRELKSRGLAVSGNKNDLIERLEAALTQEQAAAAAPVPQQSPPAVIQQPAQVVEPAAAAPEAAPEVPEPASEHQEEAKEEKENLAAENGKKSSTMMTDAERAKARAERFGVASEDTKKAARAERFGTGAPGPGSGGGTGGKIGSAPKVDLETLKRRADRFGQNNSQQLKKMELEEKIRKRRERFGDSEDAAKAKAKVKKVETNIGVNSVLLDEKMKKRAERFGL